jgi:fructose-1,6-bisphosphatase/inositol monophosphatase family enzyme
MTITLPTDSIRAWIAEAGDIACHYFRRASAEWKGVADPVTVADREIEQLVTRYLHQAYPDHGVIGEEFGGQMLDHDYLWALDPIDGTRIYVEGLPTWCISLALLHHRRPVFGLIHIPLYNDWTYTDGDDVISNGEVVTHRLKQQWAEDSYVLVRGDFTSLYEVQFTRQMSFGSTAAHLTYTARGASVATLAYDSYLWDIAAGVALILKQGGEMLHANGEPVDFTQIDPTQRIKGLHLFGHPNITRRLLPLITPRPAQLRHPVW